MVKTKKVLCSLLVVVMVLMSMPVGEGVLKLPKLGFGVKASAASLSSSGQCGDNVYWTFDSGTGEVVISGTGEMKDYTPYSDSPFYNSDIKSVVIEYGVTSIGEYALRYCKSLTIVTIPGSITSIGNAAFFGCSNLTGITIPDGVTSIGSYVFYGCTGLTSIAIPDSVTSIGDEAFRDCTGLTSVTIPDSVTSIGSYVFYGCTGLTSITVDSNNTEYSSDSYGVLFNKDKTELIQYPVSNTRTTYTIPDSVTSIGYRVFSGCTGLTSVTIPDSVTSIDAYAFYNCKDLESIIIPGSVCDLSDSAFKNCTSLKSVVFESGKRNLVIASFAFNGCTSLNNIDLHGDRVYSIHRSSFKETGYYNNATNWDNGVLYLNDIILATDPYSLGKKYTIKDGTTTLADGSSFLYMPEGGEDYTDLLPVEVSVPKTVNNIGTDCYISCDKMPDNLFRCGSLTGGNSFDFTEYAYTEIVSQTYFSMIDELVKNGFDYGEISSIDDIDFKNLSIEEKIVLHRKGVFTGTHNNFISAANSISNGGAIHLDEGIKGIGDDPLLFRFMGLGVRWLSPACFDGLILPKSFETLSLYTELNNYYSLFILYYHILAGIIEEMPEDTSKSITFLNPNCTIFDDENTLWEGYTICGYTGSTAEAYAKKYGRKFVAIDDCKHEKTCLNAKIDPTCGSKGYSGDLHCQYCGVFLEEGKMLDKLPNHSFGEPEIKTYPTCTKKGTAKFTCKDCGYEDILPYGDKTPHSYSYKYVEPTCTSNGYTLYTCECGDSYTANIVPTTGHTDNDSNGYCDKCGAELAKNCSCNCHKGGISNFFFKIGLLFQRIFGKNKYCSCGVKHY